MSQIKQTEDFKLQLYEFICQLTSMMKEYVNDVDTCKKLDVFSKVIDILNTNEEKDKLINDFIKQSNLYWKEILCQDENFFISNCDKIFGNLDNKTISQIKDLFITKKISSNDKEIVWEYLKILIIISTKYIHYRRGPKIVDSKKSYSQEFLKEINIRTIEKKCEFSLWDSIF